MYLSRLILNPRSRAVQRDLADCHDMHRTIMSAFPHVEGDAENARQRFGVLHRVEVDRVRNEILVYTQSSERPDWSDLPPGYLVPSTSRRENPACKEVGSRFALLRSGMVLAFRLRANPTRKIDTKTGPDGRRQNGRRVELRREEEQVRWLVRKAGQHGFEILTVRGRPDVPNVRNAPDATLGSTHGTRPVRKSASDGSAHRLTFGSVVFDGVLRVSDVDAFRRTLAEGIGPAKAYGHGLLSLAPRVSHGTDGFTHSSKVS